ncbi:hypothetical protein RVR34_21300 [Microcystis aeruginosa FBCC-A68]|uniref:hypothetical protein n=1 Tax=Microcystis aeruginosa TaxID=1126 RepID=UPI001BB09488|nr:hypothetical protein [Microcystis aeruginosa]
MAQVTIDYFNSSPRRAETELGWSRQAIATGLKELETGIICVDNYRARGRKKTEELLPNLEADIKSLVEMYSQADPKLQSTFAFTKISARAVREALKGNISINAGKEAEVNLENEPALVRKHRLRLH